MNLTPRQEKFAQLVASGKSQADAYREAYPTSMKWKEKKLYSKASELMAQGKVRGRVEEIRKPVVEGAQLTLDSHLKELERLKLSALVDGAHSAAIKAEELRGKASGFYIERSEAGKPGDFKDDDREKLKKRIEERNARLAGRTNVVPIRKRG